MIVSFKIILMLINSNETQQYFPFLLKYLATTKQCVLAQQIKFKKLTELHSFQTEL